jgi:integral membrane sensor domain MASE1
MYLIVVVSLTWAQRTAVIRAVNWFIAAQLLACLYIAQHKSFLSKERNGTEIDMIQYFMSFIH